MFTETDFGSRADAAALLGCSVATIDRRIRDGALTAHKLGPRLVRLDMSQVRSLLTPSTPAGA